MKTIIAIDLANACQKLGFDPTISPLGAACLEEIKNRLQSTVTIELLAACLHAAARKQPSEPKRKRKPDGVTASEPDKPATPATGAAIAAAAAAANQKGTLS